ncbi:MAG TPA: RNA polymerase sigma factor [Longimicrobiaceae bacterium]|nr:RNA polymerase sigma factor [Longimicrobiaceae bacterium]
MDPLREGMEDTLIERAKRGDAGAIRTLYERNADRVYAVVRRIAGDDSRAEDWTQEAWLRVFRALPGFRGDALFSTWVHRIAINTALHARRSTRRYEQHVTGRAVLPDVSSRLDHPHLRLDLATAVDRLPSRMRRVLVLHDIEGYTHEEIADMLGITAGTCKSQLFKARAKLREMLEPSAKRIEGEEICRT